MAFAAWLILSIWPWIWNNSNKIIIDSHFLNNLFKYVIDGRILATICLFIAFSIMYLLLFMFVSRNLWLQNSFLNYKKRLLLWHFFTFNQTTYYYHNHSFHIPFILYLLLFIDLFALHNLTTQPSNPLNLHPLTLKQHPQTTQLIHTSDHHHGAWR